MNSSPLTLSAALAAVRPPKEPVMLARGQYNWVQARIAFAKANPGLSPLEVCLRLAKAQPALYAGARVPASEYRFVP